MEELLRSLWGVWGGIFRSCPLTSQKLPLCSRPKICVRHVRGHPRDCAKFVRGCTCTICAQYWGGASENVCAQVSCIFRQNLSFSPRPSCMGKKCQLLCGNHQTQSILGGNFLEVCFRTPGNSQKLLQKSALRCIQLLSVLTKLRQPVDQEPPGWMTVLEVRKRTGVYFISKLR